MIMIREDDSNNRASFASPSSDEGRKRLNVHFPEVIILTADCSHCSENDFRPVIIVIILTAEMTAMKIIHIPIVYVVDFYNSGGLLTT